MEEVRRIEAEETWEELIVQAQEIGLSAEEVRIFLTKKKIEQRRQRAQTPLRNYQ
ncbi:DNA-binding anti-repressor SinI [Salisediminibacterium halotolerans]|uniref:DNA-binding anti-repressor SinI n=1 Tax=Salisediminibacterium halotolerans TaxID=517425 RepID=UPI000EAFEC04|nr:DNA-binding anti-repressor SinI [Salisediminibacterium halotolerans]RLJ71725.1 anti-repressor SinI [Actinophytocola xinjiangensis]RPE86875.1 anti-repressor SinI [Salisediminibacterium halotolerans]TWG32938.1 anti-repressor SinI [Salisediminibacterium halotolerans]GEL08204.1 hypothetical protein SHA02_16200 [Salisediminibacterium halotolerans]